jgi:hypothetical protein
LYAHIGCRPVEVLVLAAGSAAPWLKRVLKERDALKFTIAIAAALSLNNSGLSY